MWWLALACTPPAPTPGAPPPTAPVDTAATTPTAPTTDTGAAVGDIASVLGDCGGAFTDPGAYPNQLIPGADLHKHTLADPNARCNDGTPAVLYLRAATDPAHAHDVAVHLQGGKDCVDYDTCAARWCGDGVYDASKMSSAWTPATIGGIGLQSTLPENALAGWAHVWVYYCSSDGWNGVSWSTPPAPEGATPFRIERRGHDILAATLAGLRAGLTTDDGAVTLPPLAADATVLWTGTSIGSVGAQVHLDYAAAALAPATVFGVFDAGLAPAPDTVPEASTAQFLADSATRWQTRLTGEAALPFGEESCRDAVAADDVWQCNSASFLPYAHIETPFIGRMDLRDPVTQEIWALFGVDDQELFTGVATSLARLAALSADGPAPSAFGPACGEHLGLEVGDAFLRPRIDAPTGPLSFHDAILSALEGTRIDAIDADRTRSRCD